MFSFGVRRGYASSNPVRETEVTVTSRPDIDEEAEPFVLPPKDELRALKKAALCFDNTGRVAALIWTGMYAGLRISEARGLRKQGLKLTSGKPRLQVTQRADQFGKIGRVKGEKSLREVVLGPETAQMLSTWLEAAPDSDLVFPNAEGRVWSYSNFWNRVWVPLMNRAGLVTEEPASKTVREASDASAAYMQPRFAPHTLRHVYASLQIEQGVQPKRLQALMGHSSVQMTMDRYGHLWPDEAGDELAAKVESALA
jgi:integrase